MPHNRFWPLSTLLQLISLLLCCMMPAIATSLEPARLLQFGVLVQGFTVLCRSPADPLTVAFMPLLQFAIFA